MLYGCEFWGAAAKSSMEKIQINQNKILRSILNVSRYTATEAIQQTMNTEHMIEFIRAVNNKFYKNIKDHKNPLTGVLGNYGPQDARALIFLAQRRTHAHRDGPEAGTKVGDCLVGPVPVVSFTLGHHANRMPRTMNGNAKNHEN
ncbi:hypothetical protein PR048_031617 [Dryococelus australis]|uniref:Uncharacterized protein n=1 Tax=Dryococelus australis TaxID=614101 RepID=A0ABQ9G6T5_9NEOP|nr:hypothetical protein PR048_031617 [Dryococelus australis]